MKDYFHGLPEDVKPRPIILPLICWIGFVLGLIFLLAALSGCATVPPAEAVVIPVHVVEHEGVKMRMLPTPCKDPRSLAMAMQMSPPQYHPRWKATSSDWKMRDGTWQEFAGLLARGSEGGFRHA